MKQCVKVLAIGCLTTCLSQAAVAQGFFRGTVGGDLWWGSTKVNKVRYDEDKTPFVTLALESDFPYIPHFKFRYSEVDADYTALEKYDYTLYYDVLDDEVFQFDLGVTFSDYKNSRYTFVDSGVSRNFDGTTWGIYANGAIGIPNTDIDIIGQYDFSDRDNKKTADFLAGFEYTLHFVPTDVALRTGYRVMDYTFYKETTDEATVFIDGWFLGFQVNL